VNDALYAIALRNADRYEVADDVLEVLGHPERPEFYALGR
jgi:hypothetical protein